MPNLSPETIVRNNRLSLCGIALAMAAGSAFCPWRTQSIDTLGLGRAFPGSEVIGRVGAGLDARVVTNAFGGNLSQWLELPLWILPAGVVLVAVTQGLTIAGFLGFSNAAMRGVTLVTSLVCLVFVAAQFFIEGSSAGFGPVLLSAACLILRRAPAMPLRFVDERESR